MEDRVTQAAMQLKSKYANGKSAGHIDSSVTGPTGSAYKEQALQQKKLVAKAMKEAARHDTITGGNRDSGNHNNHDDDEDDELRQLRDARKQRIYAEHQERLENVSKGHGRYRDINQDEFLSEVTSSKYVICHFYHSDFSRCTIMDHHLNILAQQHFEAKFIKVNAEKAPFFVEKVRLLYCLYYYNYISYSNIISMLIIFFLLLIFLFLISMYLFS